MNYTTYWSILETPSSSIQSNTICLYIAIITGLLWFIVKRFKKENAEGEKTIILWAIGLFSALGTLFYIILTFFPFDNSLEMTKKMLTSPKTPRVEGVVSNFERTNRDGKETIEKFKVDSVEFAYGNAELGRFNSFTKTNNEVIFNGQLVRITYKIGSNYGNKYNTILKLELARQ